MGTEKEIEINNLSIDDYVKELHKRRAEIIENFAKAYLAETKLKPSEVVLVCRENREGNKIETIYEFRRKNERNPTG